MKVRPATRDDCRQLAELALMAGEGIPAYFWAQSQRDDEDILDVGARNLASESENFSYRNVHVAVIEDQIAGMLLAYRLPPAGDGDSPDDYPEFIRPLIELEQCVPDTFYINMLATYPEYRGMGIGSQLMDHAEYLAIQAGCDTLSLEVFEENEGAVKLYQRLGYSMIEERDVIPHSSHAHTGKMLLFTRHVQVNGV